MPNTALQRDPLYRQIYKILEVQILNNELKVGDTLPAEQALADNLQVHRSSVREAMRLLEENGLVERKPGARSSLCAHRIATRSAVVSPIPSLWRK